jgi:ferrochelatase
VSAAVLLMAHGTPSSLDEMVPYLTAVRGGRPPSDGLVAEMRSNYAAIGGRSPLTDLTFAQRDALRARLGPDVLVLAGMRNWHPYIADVLATLQGTPVDRLLAIPLAPQFSTLSVCKYVDAAATSLPPGVSLDFVESFHCHPRLLEAFAERIREAGMPCEGEDVIFTAHSLPERIIREGDPYASQVAETARGVAAAAGLTEHHVAFQSAGRTPEPWIGPDLSDAIRARAAAGARAVLVVPIGFVCDHTEILFDVDVQAAEAAREAGIALRRTASLNDSPTFISVLEDLVRQWLAAAPGGGPR